MYSFINQNGYCRCPGLTLIKKLLTAENSANKKNQVQLLVALLNVVFVLQSHLIFTNLSDWLPFSDYEANNTDDDDDDDDDFSNAAVRQMNNKFYLKNSTKLIQRLKNDSSKSSCGRRWSCCQRCRRRRRRRHRVGSEAKLFQPLKSISSNFRFKAKSFNRGRFGRKGCSGFLPET